MNDISFLRLHEKSPHREPPETEKVYFKAPITLSEKDEYETTNPYDYLKKVGRMEIRLARILPEYGLELLTIMTINNKLHAIFCDR